MMKRRNYNIVRTAATCAFLAAGILSQHSAQAQTGSWTWSTLGVGLPTPETVVGQNGGLSVTMGMVFSNAGSHVSESMDVTSLANALPGVSNVTSSAAQIGNSLVTMQSDSLDANGHEVEPSSGGTVTLTETYLQLAVAAASYNTTDGVIVSNNYPSSTASSTLTNGYIIGNAVQNLQAGSLQSDSPHADPYGTELHVTPPTTSGQGVILTYSDANAHNRGGVYSYYNGAFVWGMNVDTALGSYTDTLNYTYAYEQNFWNQHHSVDGPGLYVEDYGGFNSPSTSVSASNGSGAAAISMQTLDITGVASM